MARSIRDTQGVKVRVSKNEDPQPYGVYLHTNTVPGHGDILHLCRYYEDKKGRLCMGYRTPKMASGKHLLIYDDCYIPMEVVPRVAQEMLKLCGVSELKQLPTPDERKKTDLDHKMRLLGMR